MNISDTNLLWLVAFELVVVIFLFTMIFLNTRPRKGKR